MIGSTTSTIFVVLGSRWLAYDRHRQPGPLINSPGYDTSAWFWGSMFQILIAKYLL